jgi:hypothetical protein
MKCAVRRDFGAEASAKVAAFDLVGFPCLCEEHTGCNMVEKQQSSDNVSNQLAEHHHHQQQQQQQRSEDNEVITIDSN